MGAEYKPSGNKAYLAFGFIMFWLCILVLHSLIALIVYGPDYELVLRFLSWDIAYTSAKSYFLYSALIASFCFCVICYRVACDLKRDNSYRLYEMTKEAVKNSEERTKNYFDKKFGQISMDQYDLSKEFEAFKKSAFEKMESASSELKSCRQLLDGQKSNIKDLKKEVEEVKVRLSPKPYLTVLSNVEKVVGVGKKTAAVFKSAGIEHVQELISEDSKALAEKTGLSEGVIAKIQAAAKMLIVPGFNAKVVKTLQKVGVHFLGELACQSPMELYTRIIRTCGKEALSLDEIAFCVRAAQRYTSKNLDVVGPSVLAYVEG